MENNENKRVSLLVEESDKKTKGFMGGDEKPRFEKFKKPIIYMIMVIVFLGCLYLIFKPSATKKEKSDSGLNDAVPQASEIGMESDKQKAYEQAMMDEKNQQKKNMLTSLSDYWSSDSTDQINNPTSNISVNQAKSPLDKSSQTGYPALNSYRNAQATLGSFYNSDENYESKELRKEIAGLKRQLDERDAAPTPMTVNDQLHLMEKSYQMAAKYLPSAVAASHPDIEKTEPQKTANEKETFMAIKPVSSTSISSLYRERSDSAFMADWSKSKNSRFFTIGNTIKSSLPKNSISAVVHGSQVITEESTVKLRLLENVQTPYRTIPKGTILSAPAKIQGSRVNLKITSIETEGSIIPVDIQVYDLDGQLGLNLPYAPEVNALSEVTANMSQSSGTSIMMTRSAGQQITGELGKGLLQGVSGYLSKKLRTPKVTLKDGHHVFLYSKK